jgi:hypothetical protein
MSKHHDQDPVAELANFSDEDLLRMARRVIDDAIHQSSPNSRNRAELNNALNCLSVP